MTESLSFVHFSDTHVVRPGVRLHDVDTCETLTRVVEAVNRLTPPPAFVVIGGDLVSPDVDPEVRANARALTVRDYETSYEVLQGLLSRLTMPVHFVMGNHDRRVPFHRVILNESQPWDRPHYYAFEAGPYRISILDSLVPGQDGGYLSPPQLAWLRQDLQRHADAPTILVVHHHAVPVGFAGLDQIMLMNAEDFWMAVRESRNVCAVLCGHVHLRHETVREGIPLFTTPSTCFQFAEGSDTWKFLPGPPMLRLVTCQGREVSSTVMSVARESPASLL